MEAHKNGTQPLWASEKPTVKLSSSYFRRFQVGPNLIQNLGQAPEEPNPWIQNLQIGRINLCTNTLHITTTIIYIPNSSPVLGLEESHRFKTKYRVFLYTWGCVRCCSKTYSLMALFGVHTWVTHVTNRDSVASVDMIVTDMSSLTYPVLLWLFTSTVLYLTLIRLVAWLILMSH